MSKFQTLAFFVLSALPLLADSILWEASGTLDSGTGVFLRQDLSPGDPVTIQITYDDLAIPQFRGGFFDQEEKDYRTDIDLKIMITSGNYTWEGFVESGDATSPTTFVTITNETRLSESIELTISSGDNGTFPSFPFRIGESDTSLNLDFKSTGFVFLDKGIGVADIHPEELDSATGKISTGVGNDLSFTIDPGSLEIMLEPEVVVPLIIPPLTLTSTAEAINLSWPSEFRARYLIESTADLSAEIWTEVETRFGTDTSITRTYPRSTDSLFYRVTVLPRTPLE